MIRSLAIAILIVLLAGIAEAHEVRPALLKVTELSGQRFLVQWKVPAMGNQRLAIDPVFTSGCVEVGSRVNGFSSGASVRSWNMECSESLANTEIRFSNLSSTMIDVLVQVTFLDGRYYTGLVRPSAPTFHVPDRANQASVFGDYLSLGVEHILFGWDHLLFVLGLILVISDQRRLFFAVTGFTVAHSITLGLATLDVIRVPGPPVEAVIALSIVLLAVEATRSERSETRTLAVRFPWLVSMAIGLVHGLGFAGALSEYGLPGHAQFISLLAFNLGVEVGQVLFIAVLLIAAASARRFKFPLLPQLRIATVWFIGICGSFWLTERVVGFF